MKKVKQILALTLAAILVLGMAIPIQPQVRQQSHGLILGHMFLYLARLIHAKKSQNHNLFARKNRKTTIKTHEYLDS